MELPVNRLLFNPQLRPTQHHAATAFRAPLYLRGSGGTDSPSGPSGLYTPQRAPPGRPGGGYAEGQQYRRCSVYDSPRALTVHHGEGQEERRRRRRGGGGGEEEEEEEEGAGRSHRVTEACVEL
ncbi:hypothetical protein EYF80_061499 [Liparis tanakae]|uniref:Uncharacterized protein n=1 Tax=Liparis tanakae TaxID=230148 RepID=A0A4Z2EHQ9_9TELE|nr:hypothetical protein EYF80_061499 [Liparis tanakae]